MQREHRDVPSGYWLPWLGLALIMPAVLVFLVTITGILSNTQRAPSGWLVVSGDPGIGGIGGGFVVTVAAFAGLMLGILGLVRGLRRKNSPRDGSSIGIAGNAFEIGVIVLAIVALASLGWFIL